MINNFNVCLIENSKMDELLLNKIVSLKQQYWPYSYNSQIEWMNNNLSAFDYHLLLIDNNENVFAYMNLVKRTVNGNSILGMGNVCVSKNRMNQGIGKLLIQISLYYAKQLSLDIGLLCKKELVGFYEKCGFYQFQNKVFINDDIFNNCLMFSTNKYCVEKEININKDF